MNQEIVHILIADDDLLSRVFLTELCKRKNFEIVQAKNGIEAIKAFEENDQFDLIFMDIRMPELNGTEVVKKIRERERERERSKFCSIIVVHSALPPWSNERQEIKSYVDCFIEKPTSMNVLEELLNKVENLRKERNINLNLIT